MEPYFISTLDLDHLRIVDNNFHRSEADAANCLKNRGLDLFLSGAGLPGLGMFRYIWCNFFH